MLWLAKGLGLAAAMLATVGLLIRVVEAIGAGRLPRATLLPVLAVGAGLVGLAFHLSNPDLGLVVFVVGVVAVATVIGVATGMLLAAVLPSRHQR